MLQLSNSRRSGIPVQEFLYDLLHLVHILGPVGGIELQAGKDQSSFSARYPHRAAGCASLCLYVRFLNDIPFPGHCAISVIKGYVSFFRSILTRVRPGQLELDGGEHVVRFQPSGQFQVLLHRDGALGRIIGICYYIGAGLTGSGGQDFRFLAFRIVRPLHRLLPQDVGVQIALSVVPGEGGTFTFVFRSVRIIPGVVDGEGISPVHVDVGPVGYGNPGDPLIGFLPLTIRRRFSPRIPVHGEGDGGQVLLRETAGPHPDLPPLDGHLIGQAVGNGAALQQGVVGIVGFVVLGNRLVSIPVFLHVEDQIAVLASMLLSIFRQCIPAAQIDHAVFIIWIWIRVVRHVVVVGLKVDLGALHRVVEDLVPQAVILLDIGQGDSPGIVGVIDIRRPDVVLSEELYHNIFVLIVVHLVNIQVQIRALVLFVGEHIVPVLGPGYRLGVAQLVGDGNRLAVMEVRIGNIFIRRGIFALCNGGGVGAQNVFDLLPCIILSKLLLQPLI